MKRWLCKLMGHRWDSPVVLAHWMKSGSRKRSYHTAGVQELKYRCARCNADKTELRFRSKTSERWYRKEVRQGRIK